MPAAYPLMLSIPSPQELAYEVSLASRVILLSEGTWRNRFALDPDIVGRAVLVDGVAATVVGPAPFRFPND